MTAAHRATHSVLAAPLSRRRQPCSRRCQVPGKPAVPCWTGSAAPAERTGNAAATSPDPHHTKAAVPADAACGEGRVLAVVGRSGGGNGQPDARPRPGRGRVAAAGGDLAAPPGRAGRRGRLTAVVQEQAAIRFRRMARGVRHSVECPAHGRGQADPRPYGRVARSSGAAARAHSYTLQKIRTSEPSNAHGAPG